MKVAGVGGVRRALDAVAPLVFAIALTGAAALGASFGSGPIRATAVTGLINLILVVGLYVFVGNSGVLSFGHAGLMAVGGYMVGILSMPPDIKGSLLPGLPDLLAQHQVSPVPATILGGLAAAIVAAVVAVPIVRMSPLQAGLATVALLLVMRVVLLNWSSVTGGGPGLAPVAFMEGIPTPFLWAVGAITVAFLFQRSATGLRLRASREDGIAARSVGIRVGRERGIAFVISGFITGVGGGLFVQSVGAVDPNAFYLTTTFLVLVMLIVGGINTLTGAVVGTIVITVISHFLLDVEQGSIFGIVNVPVKAGTRDVVLSLIMLVILLVRPQGLVGDREFSWPKANWDRARRESAFGLPSGARQDAAAARTAATSTDPPASKQQLEQR
jgi:branched-chain amino acid transport system permease protein